MPDGLGIGSSGRDVEELQEALALRARPRGYPQLVADGELGPATFRAYQDLGWALGLRLDTLRRPEIAKGALELVLEPRMRNAAQLERARLRAPKLARRTILVDAAPTYWGLAKPLMRARRHGWSGQLSSADRRKGVVERFGKRSQVTLFSCFQRRLATGRCPPECAGNCAGANAPGFSSHEQRSDGTAFPGPRGRLLQWWELGLDVARADELLEVLGDLGYSVRRTYANPQEHHHLNLTRDPGPVVPQTRRRPKDREAPAPAPEPRREPKLVRWSGPDVSMYQGDVDWVQVRRAGHELAIVKATEGRDFKDPNFGPARWAALEDARLIRGAYHFARPQPGRDPREEAEHFLETVEDAGGFASGDLAPVLDLEWTKGLSAGELLDWARGFVDAVHDELAIRPIVYTGHFWRETMGDPPENLGCGLWLAAYVRDPRTWIPRAWAEPGLVLWQHTDRGTCPGVSGPCDMNEFRGPRSALDAVRFPAVRAKRARRTRRVPA